MANRPRSPTRGLTGFLAYIAAEQLRPRPSLRCLRTMPLQACRTVSQDVTECCSHGLVTLDRDPVHDAALAVIVVKRVVLGAAVVPDRQRARFPAEATGELGPHKVVFEIVEQRLALLNGHTIEPNCVRRDIERFAAGLRVRAHDWMRGIGDLIFQRLACLHCGLLLKALAASASPIAHVEATQWCNQPLHAVGEGLVGGITAGE